MGSELIHVVELISGALPSTGSSPASGGALWVPTNDWLHALSPTAAAPLARP
jgi:hypothetical protein